MNIAVELDVKQQPPPHKKNDILSIKHAKDVFGNLQVFKEVGW